ncbi:MAG: outer membrane lipoprotein chaperone LolA [Gemmatimonadota bacterium]
MTLALTLALAVPAALPGRAAAQDPTAVLARADRALAALTTLRAGFTQQVVNPALERTSTGRGTLSYRAPDRFRIAYADPAGDVVVNDGRRVWIYLPSAQPGQVIRQPAAESGVANPLTYLRDLRGQYTARLVGAGTVAGQRADHLALVPRSAAAPFAGLDIWIDRATGLTRQVRTVVAGGVTTTYTFTAWTPGAALRDDVFRFRIPRGVEVFDQ